MNVRILAMQQSQIVHQKNDNVGFWRRQRISFARDTSPALEEMRSLVTDVAGMHNMVCATELRIR